MILTVALVLCGFPSQAPDLVVQRNPGVFGAAAALTVDGNYAVLSVPTGISLWDARSGKLVRWVSHAFNQQWTVAVDFKDLRYIEGSQTGFRLKNLLNGESTQLETRVGQTLGFSFDSAGKSLIELRFEDQRLHVLALSLDGQLLRKLGSLPIAPPRTQGPESSEVQDYYYLDRESSYLAQGGTQAQQVRIWEIASGATVRTFRNKQVAFACENQLLISDGEEQPTLSLTKIATPSDSFEIGQVSWFTVSPNGRWLLTLPAGPPKNPASLEPPPPCTLFDLASRTRMTLPQMPDLPQAIDDSGERVLCRTTAVNGPFTLRSASSGGLLVTFGEQPLGMMMSMYVRHDAPVLVVPFFRAYRGNVMSWDRVSNANILVWDLKNGVIPRLIPVGQSGAVIYAAFSADGRFAATIDAMGVAVYPQTGGDAVVTIPAPFQKDKPNLTKVSLSGDGRRLFLLRSDGIITVYEAQPLKKVAEFKAPQPMFSASRINHEIPYVKELVPNYSGSRALLKIGINSLLLLDVAGERFAEVEGRYTPIVSPDQKQIVWFSATRDALPNGGIVFQDFETLVVTGKASTGMTTLLGCMSQDTSLLFFQPGILPGRDLANSSCVTDREGVVLKKLELRPLALGEAATYAFSHDGRLLFRQLADSLEIYDWRANKLTATLYVSQYGEAVAVTPLGFYAATRSGHKILGVRYGNRGYDLEHLDLALNRPDLVAKAIGYVAPEQAAWLEWLNKKRLERAGIVVPAQSLEGLTTVTLDRSKVSAQAAGAVEVPIRVSSGANGLKTLFLWINGVPVDFLWDGTKKPATGCSLGNGKSVRGTARVELSDGLNAIDVAVMDQVGVYSLKERLFVRNSAPPSPRRMFVACIGVSNYKNIPRLDWAATDANAVADLFKTAPLGFPEGSIHTLVLLEDQVDKEVTARLREFLKEAKRSDRVIVFFSGHGLVRDLNYYFGTPKIDPKDPASEGISLRDIEHVLGQVPSRYKLLLLDTCHAGQLDRESIQFGPSGPITPLTGTVKEKTAEMELSPAWQSQAVNAADIVQEIFSDPVNSSGVVVIGACAGSQFALELGSLRAGVFTHALIAALKPNPQAGRLNCDADLDGEITTAELVHWVTIASYNLTRGRQRPVLRQGLAGHDFPVGHYIGQVAPQTPRATQSGKVIKLRRFGRGPAWTSELRLHVVQVRPNIHCTANELRPIIHVRDIRPDSLQRQVVKNLGRVLSRDQGASHQSHAHTIRVGTHLDVLS